MVRVARKTEMHARIGPGANTGDLRYADGNQGPASLLVSRLHIRDGHELRLELPQDTCLQVGTLHATRLPVRPQDRNDTGGTCKMA